MESFIRHHGKVAPILRPDIDTDQIIPVREMVDVVTDNYGAGLFANWRYLRGREPDPAFILNRAPWADASILVAGRNFGCGSSRELAPRALRDFGFRCVIAPSFAPIFFGNCFRNGLLPVELPEPVVEDLARRAESGGGAFHLTVDLEAQTVVAPDGTVHAFATPASPRRMLLEGADEIDQTLRRLEAIDRFIAADRVARPWAHAVPGRGDAG